MVGGVGTMMFFLIQVMTCDAWTDPVRSLVERFDRRGIEPFELFRSEFGQNSVRIREMLLEFIRNSKKNQECSTFSRISVEIPRNFHENLSNIQ